VYAEMTTQLSKMAKGKLHWRIVFMVTASLPGMQSSRRANEFATASLGERRARGTFAG
jgi:hypothetical protein